MSDSFGFSKYLDIYHVMSFYAYPIYERRMSMYQHNSSAFLNPNYQTPTFYQSANPQDDRFGGFLGPFLLGGITGGLVAPFFYGGGYGGGYNQPYYTNNYYYPPYPIYGPYM